MQPKLFIAVSLFVVATLSALVAAMVAYNLTRRATITQSRMSVLQSRNLEIVDEHGKTWMSLSATDGSPAVRLLDASGQDRITMTVNKSGYSSVRLSNPNSSGSVAALEIDDKGAHVKFDRPGGASSYLFLNDSGGSGVVLIDSKGSRKLDLMVAPNGETEFRRYDEPSSAAKGKASQ